MSELTVSMRAEALLARLAGSQGRLQDNMRRAVDRLSIEIQGLVKQKLSGDVLSVRTGTLRRSINRQVEEQASSVIATVGTNVRYAAAHEYGFSGTVQVKAYTRRTPSGGTANVGAFQRQMNLPKRSFLVSTLNEQANKIRTELRAAALEAVTP